MNALIVGGSGGIGKAFVRYLLNQGEYEVHATYHKTSPDVEHDKCTWSQVDVSDEQEVSDFCMQLGEIDLCINAVGILHDGSNMPEKATRQIDPEFFLKTMQINVLPTMLLAKYLTGHFRHDRPSVFAAVSARVGSIAENRLGGWYSYRASKAALNQVLKTLSIEWQRNLKNVSVAALHPGTTDTELSKPFHRNVPAEQLFSPEKSVAYMMQVIESLTPRNTGNFWSFDGQKLPW